MKYDYDEFWERCWQEENTSGELHAYLDGYFCLQSREIEIFKEYNIVNVCDAACGFGAYSLAFASNGFLVNSFDISETAVEITRDVLRKYGMDASRAKVAGIMDTGYETETFDGVIAHAVVDHLTLEDARKAIRELYRITRKNGLLMVSFDMAEEEDLQAAHVLYEDGTMQYTSGSRRGMLFHPYDWAGIGELLKDYHIIYKADKGKRERVVILRKE